MTWSDKGTEREKELREIEGRLGKLREAGEYEWCENEGAVRVEEPIKKDYEQRARGIWRNWAARGRSAAEAVGEIYGVLGDADNEIERLRAEVGMMKEPIGGLEGRDWIWDGQDLWVKASGGQPESKEGFKPGSKPESELGGPASKALEGWLERGRVAEMLEEVWEVLKAHYAEGWRLEMIWDGVEADEDSDEFQRGELEIRLMTPDRSKVVLGRGEEWAKAREAIRFAVNGFLGDEEGE